APIGGYPRHVLAANPHLGGCWHLEPGDQTQGCRLAASGRPEKREEPATFDREAHIPYSGDSPKFLAHVAKTDVPDRLAGGATRIRRHRHPLSLPTLLSAACHHAVTGETAGASCRKSDRIPIVRAGSG